MEKRLYRSRDDRMIWGVCGGLGKYFDIDPVIIRVIMLLLIFAGGIGILAYIILAIVVPLESSQASEPKDIIRENVEEMRQTATQVGGEIRATFEKKGGEPEEMAKSGFRARYILGIIIVVIGVIFLLGNFFSWLSWKFLWPLFIVAIGLLIIFGTRRR